MDYQAFLETKAQHGAEHGFEPLWLPSFLKEFQAALCDWSTRKGRSLLSAARVFRYLYLPEPA